VSRAGLLRALAAIFSSFNVLYRYSEARPTPGGPRVLTCRLAHLGFVSMKVRQHLITRSTPSPDQMNINDAAIAAVEAAGAAAGSAAAAAGASPAAESAAVQQASAAVAAVQMADMAIAPALNTGHRAERVDELPILSGLLAAQAGRTSNGLRLIDGTDPRRTITTRPATGPVPVASDGGVGHSVALAAEISGPRGPVAAVGSSAGVLLSSADAAGAGTAVLGEGTGTLANGGRALGQSDTDDDANVDHEDEEEAPVRRHARGGAAARRERLEALREEAARAAAANVLLEEID